MSTRITAGLLTLLTCLVAPAVQAQTGEAWERGVSLRADGRDAEALAVFEAEHTRTGSSATLAQVALAEQALSRWGAAAAHLEQALAAPDAWVQSNRAALIAASQQIAPHIGHIQLTVDQPGARVTVGGHAVGTTPLAAPVPASAGSALVRVRSAGGATVERTVQVQAGATSALSITLTGVATSGGGGGLTIGGAVLLGLAGAALVPMAVTWHLREEGAREWNGPCFSEPGRSRQDECPTLPAQISLYEGLAIGMGVLAGLAAVGGVALLALGAGEDSSSASMQCTPGLTGLHCSGRF